jgi:hypothetical protein
MVKQNTKRFIPFGADKKKGTDQFGQYDFDEFLCRQGTDRKKRTLHQSVPYIITPNAPSICY